jgi:hypothetical protein
MLKKIILALSVPVAVLLLIVLAVIGAEIYLTILFGF